MSDVTSISAVLLAATMSEAFTHPLEVIKTKKQIKYSLVSPGTQIPSQFAMIRKYIQNKAVKDLYKGFSPAIIKGVQLQTIRFGLYDMINQFMQRSVLPKDTGSHGVFFSKLLSAFTSSVIAGVTANPWMILKVRMIADKSGDYKTLRQSFRSITKTDGYQEFLKGTSISLARGVVLSTVELTIYDTFKGLFRTKEGLDLKASSLASIVASLSGALVSYPLDVLRTLYMVENSGKSIAGDRGFRQISRIFKNVYQTRGIRGLYQGFMPCVSKSLIYGPLFWNSLELSSYLCKNYATLLSGKTQGH